MKTYEKYLRMDEKVSNKVKADKIIKTIKSSKTLEQLATAKKMRDKFVKSMRVKPLFGAADDEYWAQMDKALDDTKDRINHLTKVK